MHPYYKYKLGQIVSLPLQVNEKYEDDFMIAHPITSLQSLAGDRRFEEFLTLISPIGSDKSVLFRTYFPAEFGNGQVSNSIKEYYNKVSVFGGISLAFSHDSNLRHTPNSSSANSQFINFPYMFFDYGEGSDGGHTHDFLSKPTLSRVQLANLENASGSGETFIVYARLGEEERYYLTGTVTKELDSNPLVNSDYKLPYPPYRAVAVTADTKTLVYRDFPDGIGFIGNDPIASRYTNRVSTKEVSIIIDRETETPMEAYFYNTSLDPSITDNPLNNYTFTVPSIGVNMLVVTQVKRNIIDEEDLDYLRSQVGEIFYSIAGKDYVLSSESFEIRSLYDLNPILKADYPDFFGKYSITTEDPLLPSNVIFGEINPLDLSLLSLRNASTEEEVANLSLGGSYCIDEDIINKSDVYSPHTRRLVSDKPTKTKAIAGTDYLIDTFDYDASTLKASTPNYDSFSKVYTKSRKQVDLDSKVDTKNPQDLKVFPYVIIKCKV